MPLLLLTGLPAQAHAQEAAVHTVRPGDTLTCLLYTSDAADE